MIHSSVAGQSPSCFIPSGGTLGRCTRPSQGSHRRVSSRLGEHGGDTAAAAAAAACAAAAAAAAHLWFGKSVILGRLSKQKFDLSKPCSWCSNRGRKPAWPPHSQPNTITTKKRQFEFLKKGDYSTQQTFHTFDLLKCQTVSYYGTKRPCCVFLCCASALCTLTAVKRIEK